MWSWKYRESVCDILELISGNRQHYSMFKIGGVRKDIPQDLIPQVEKMCNDLVPVLDMFKGAIMDDPVIQARTKGVGVLSRQDAINYSVVGPTARASGIDIDIRRDDPYAAYDIVKFNVIVLQNGDVFDKAVVRVLEMYESTKIINQCLEILKKEKGEIETKVHFIPAGEGIGRHEAPRGEVFHYIKSDGSNRPIRHKIRAPSYVNVASNKVAAVGQTVSDSAITLAAVDPCYCCTERAVVVDKNDNILMRYGDLIKLSQQKTEQIKEKLKK
jgi:NADH-quinone oxidoreductase subunit D